MSTRPGAGAPVGAGAAVPDRLAHPGALAGGPVDWAAARRVLVVRPDNLGDVLALGPALRALAAAAPGAHVTLLASPAGAPAAALLPEVDEVLVHAPTWQLAGRVPAPDPAAELELVQRVRSGRHDAAVVFTSFSQSPWPAAYVCHLAGVPVRVGMSKEFGGALLSHWVPSPTDDQHQVDRSLQLLAAVGVPAVGTTLHAHVPSETPAPGPAAPYAVLLPGASCSSRRWSAERFAAVAAGLEDRGLAVVVAGPPAERELLERVCRSGGSPRSDLDVVGLAALLRGARVAVTNNSGGMHLADALGVPLVVLFAGTEQEGQYAPRSTTATVLRVPTPCSPCRLFSCPYGHECLDVDPAAVVDAALAPAGAAR